MNIVLDPVHILSGLTLGVCMIIGFFIKAIFSDFRNSKQTIVALQIEMAKINTKLDSVNLQAWPTKMDKLQDDIAVLNRNQGTIFSRIDNLRTNGEGPKQ